MTRSTATTPGTGLHEAVGLAGALGEALSPPRGRDHRRAPVHHLPAPAPADRQARTTDSHDDVEDKDP
ncbi:hypothetical protein [Kineococcus arenarius]|uniref:hypothetical protein n=1 Tax=unclassified Kineococcus TaxID=2621656 RepID=UPI003D7C77BC